MSLLKKLFILFSFLLIPTMLFTGCSPETEELAAELLTGIIEAELEDTEGYDTEDYNIEDYDTSGASADELTKEDTELSDSETIDIEQEPEETVLDEHGTYTTKDEVAAYLHTYGHLPSNFITKKAAKKLGWVSSEGNLDEVAPGMSIGGDYFGNYEGILPKADGRDYYECDIDFDGTYRNAKRIVYSNDGLIYYTEDHYETFELLYGEE